MCKILPVKIAVLAMSRSERLLELLQALRRHRHPVSGQTLAQETGVSLRTIYRDIATLQAQGADIEGEPGLGYILKPGFMLLFLMAFTFAAVQFLLPMTSNMFSGIGAEPPLMSVIVMAVGDWLKWVLLAIILIVLLVGAAWKLFLKNVELIAARTDAYALRAPLVGDIMRMATAARFCDVLAAGLSVGMSELESLETAGRACGNRALAQWIDEHVGRQRYGVVAFNDVAKTEMFPWNLRNRLETTSSLTRRIEILLELAETFHRKSQERLNRFAERIGPISEGVVVCTVIGVVLLIVAPILTFIPTLVGTLA